MARLFDDAASEYLEHASAVVSGPPLSFSCLFRSNDNASLQALVNVGTNGNTNRFDLRATGTVGGDPIRFLRAEAGGGTVSTASTSTGYTANQWHQAGAVAAATNSGAVYIDGGSKGTNTTTIDAGTIDTTNIGTRWITTRGAFMSGDIAEVGIWNAALDDAEMASLGKFVSPLFIRPESLVFYWPGVRTLNDTVGGLVLTASGTAVSDHPRILYPSNRSVIVVPAAAAATRNDLLLLGVGA